MIRFIDDQTTVQHILNKKHILNCQPLLFLIAHYYLVMKFIMSCSAYLACLNLD